MRHDRERFAAGGRRWGVGAAVLAMAAMVAGAAGLAVREGVAAERASRSSLAALTGSGQGWVAARGVGLAGARVTATAWPNAATLGALPYGASVPLVQVGTATTDATGTYALVMDLSRLGSAYRAPSGAVNLEIDVSGPRGLAATWNVPIPGRRVRAQPSRVALPAFGFDLDAARVRGPGIPRGGAALAVRQAAPAVDTTQEPVASPGPPQPCKVVALARLRGRPERFLDVHAWSGAPARVRVRETYGSSHSVGVGVSADGDYWSASGEVDVESSESTTVITPAFADNRWVGNAIDYRKFATWCPSGYSNWRAQSTGLDALLPSRFVSHKIPKAHLTHCFKYDAGSAYIRNHGRNATFSGGVRLRFLNLSAHAEMTRQTSEKWDVSRGTWICGNGKKLVGSVQVGAFDHRPKG